MAQYIGLIETMTTTLFPWSEELLTFVESSNMSDETTAASNCLTNFTLNSTLACSNTSATLNCQPVQNKPTLRMIVEIQKWIGPPVLIFGILSNIMTLLTLRGMDLSPYVHLSWLAIADLSGLVLILIDHYNDPSDRQWMMFRIYVYYPLSNLAAMMGVWIMVLVTLERCIFIRYMMAPLWCTPSRARAKVLGVFLICSALNGPRFFWFKVALKHRADLPLECPPVYQICPYLQAWSGAKALTWIYSTILNFLPLCLLMAFNGFLIYSVKARRRLRPTLGVADTSDTVWSSEQTRFTLTVIAIVGLFIVLVMPSAFSDTNILFPLLGVTHMTEAVHVFQYISNFLMWLNMSINFLLYTAINIRFQEAFKAMYRKWLIYLRCGKHRDRKHHHHHHHYKNGIKPRPMLSLPCNGTGDQFASHRPVIKFRQEGQTSNGLTKKAADEEASCGRKFRMFRALVPFTRRSRRWRKSQTGEESFPLRPSVRSCSTGTSGSSSQSPTEATEICPMLAMTLTIPPKIQEADSLTLATATPMTPLNEVISPDDVFPPTPERTTCPTFQTHGTSGRNDAIDVGALSPDRDHSDHTIEVNHNNPATLKVHVSSRQNPRSVLEFGSTDPVTEGGALQKRAP